LAKSHIKIFCFTFKNEKLNIYYLLRYELILFTIPHISKGSVFCCSFYNKWQLNDKTLVISRDGGLSRDKRPVISYDVGISRDKTLVISRDGGISRDKTPVI
jgi:hypothetical protein